MWTCAWISFAVLLVGTAGAPAGQSVQDFLDAERNFAGERSQQVQEVSVIGNVAAHVDPFTEGTIRNARLRSGVPQIISVDPNLARLNLGVVASLGTVVIDGEVNISSSSTSYRFACNVTIAYSNVSASGTAGVLVAQDVPRVTSLDLAYTPQNRSSRVSFDEAADGDLGQLAEAFFEENVEWMAVAEMNDRVARQLNQVLKGVSGLEVFGDAAAMQRTQEFVNPVGNVNLLVDTLLAKMLPKIPSSVSLDDVDRPFKRTFLFVPIFGNFRATNGTLKDLKTLRRTSDVFLNVTSSGIRLTGAMGLDVLQFAYDYDINVLDIGPSGRLEGAVGNNSLNFALKVTYDGLGSCAVHIEELRIERLEDLEIKITGLGILNRLVSSITTSVVNDSKDKIVAHIEESLNRNLKSAADKVGLCDVFPGS